MDLIVKTIVRTSIQPRAVGWSGSQITLLAANFPAQVHLIAENNVEKLIFSFYLPLPLLHDMYMTNFHRNFSQKSDVKLNVELISIGQLRCQCGNERSDFTVTKFLIIKLKWALAW